MMTRLPQIIGIVGSRRRTSPYDYHILVQTFDSIYLQGDIILSGGCPTGGDEFAERIGRERTIPVYVYGAEWEKYGRKAGHIRNTPIAHDCTILLALVADDRTGGTEDTIHKTLAVGTKVVLL